MIYKNISLKKYNTFGIDHKAEFLIQIKTEEEAASLFDGTVSLKKPLLIIGGGSNILFTSDFMGTILYPDIEGIKIEKNEPGDGNVIVSAGAGVSWDDLVDWSVNKGFGGLENLSLIPGKVGATPVQNIGAYGVEVGDQITKVRTISTNDGSVRIFNHDECDFGYRTSIFKNREKGNYLITRVYYKFTTKPSLNLSYESLKEEVDNLGKETLETVRRAVIKIRQSKLPDPGLIGNAGSFFKNPVVESSAIFSLKNDYPGIPVFEDKSGHVKLAAGWLIEQCGWKGKRTGNAGIHEKQALVLINFGNATGTEIFNLSEEIKKSVYQKFGIELEREVEVIGLI
jgi:UDP-N-acetylmuramate dehydrogenase